MPEQQVTTKTRGQILVDNIRHSPVDEYLAKIHLRILGIVLVLVVSALIVTLLD